MEERAIHIEFVSRAGDIDADLWRTCFPAPLEGRFWFDALEASGLEDQFTFFYAVIRAGGVPVGIAPCFLYDVPMTLVAPPAAAAVLRFLSKLFPRVNYQRTLFVGSPCSDEGTIGFAPGANPADAIGPLVRALRGKAREHKASMIVFKDFPEAAFPVFGGLCRDEGFFPVTSYPGTRVRLPGPDKGAYFRSLTHHQRYNFQKKLRRSMESLSLETRVVKTPSDAELEEIYGLYLQTYERGKTKFERLTRRFFEKIREQEPAWFILQRDAKTGRLLTFMLLFRGGDRVINKFIGIDYRRLPEKAFLYFRLFDAALDFAYAAGAQELQSGQTGYSAKLDLGHRLALLINICQHKNPFFNALYRAIGGRVTWKTLDDDLATFLRAHPESDCTLPVLH